MTKPITINSDQSLNAYIEHIKSQYEKHKYLKVSISAGKTRSLTQNQALHKYFTMLADELNAGGFDMRRTLKQDVDMPWTTDSVKHHLWRPLQEVITKQVSTAKVDSKDYSKIYDVLSRHLSQKLGIFISWPSRDTMNERN